MAKITANNIQTGSITLDTLSSSVVNSITSASESGTKAQDAFDKANTGTLLAQSAFDAANTVSPLDSFSRQTANAAFTQANASTILAQAAFNAANNASGGGGASGGFVNLNMPGTLNVPFTGTSRYYPTTSITLGTVYANLSASPSANLQFVILKNGANIGNSFIITTSSPVMTPVVLSGVSLTTNDYLTLNLLGSEITAADLWVRISYS
jgi:hypothetical protein